MAKIDGALHIQPTGKLLAFGCLLDGRSCAEEDRARGGRYNSALRFTKENPKSFIITVSSDGPVSFFCQGKDLTNINPAVLTGARAIELL
jgi:DNA integrity scanning protein DisA with diadenylate cyclase activity